MGSGSFAIPTLTLLVERGHEVAAVVTQPDRESGRGRTVQPPPVKIAANRLGLDVRQPRRIRDGEVIAALTQLSPDLQVVAAYGQILPQPVIEIPRLGTLNVHASLLPRYRGAAPIQWAIANGETVTGVTIMVIDAGLDTGPTLLSRSTPIGAEETSPQLQERLAELGAGLLIEALRGLEAGTLTPRVQDHAAATLAPMLRKEDGRVDWQMEAKLIADRVRAFTPWPGVFTHHAGKLLRLHRVRAVSGVAASPATVGAVDRDGVVVGCGSGTALRLLDVQPESRRVMPAAAFAPGARLLPGAKLGP